MAELCGVSCFRVCIFCSYFQTDMLLKEDHFAFCQKFGENKHFYQGSSCEEFCCVLLKGVENEF